MSVPASFPPSQRRLPALLLVVLVLATVALTWVVTRPAEGAGSSSAEVVERFEPRSSWRLAVGPTGGVLVRSPMEFRARIQSEATRMWTTPDSVESEVRWLQDNPPPGFDVWLDGIGTSLQVREYRFVSYRPSDPYPSWLPSVVLVAAVAEGTDGITVIRLDGQISSSPFGF